MSKLFKYSLFIAIPIAAFALAQAFFQDKNEEAMPEKETPKVSQDKPQDNQPESTDILLTDLKISPIRSLENEVYLLTAFDMSDEQTMVIVGNYSKENVVRFFDLGTNEIISELKLDEIALDVYSHHDSCYVLGEKSIFIIYNNQIIHSFKHGILDVFTFDRMLSLGDELFVSMSDGSAWQVDNQKVEKRKKLVLNDGQLWIQKKAVNAFSIDISDNKTIDFTSNLPLGAMTILGAINNDLICVTERITNAQPMNVERIVCSSKDDFSSELQTAGMQPYAFLKNDLRLHGDLVYHLILQKDQLSLTTERIEE